MTLNIGSTDGYKRTLSQLLTSAIDQRLDPSGSWEIRNGETHPDWEVQVVELEKPD